MYRSIDGLVNLVAEYQKKKGWNETELCHFLGIRTDSWSLIKHGHRKPTMSFRQAVWDKIPGLRDYIFIK